MNGARVAITAARRAQEQAALVRALGGVPEVAPCVGPDRAAARRALEPVMEWATGAPLDIAVFLTGVGARHLMEAAEAAGRGPALERALSGAEVVARGPKTRRALAGLGIGVRWTADPPEARAVGARLRRRDLAGARVLVQCAGAAPEPLVGMLAAAGADARAAHPYGYGDAPDARAAAALAGRVAEGRVDAVTFTSATAVAAFADLLEARGGAPADGVLVAAVGPVTREALHARGWRVDVEPPVARMGALYQALARCLSGGAPA